MSSQPMLENFLSETDDLSSFHIWVNRIAERANAGIPLRLWLSQQISLIDEVINEQINLILHHPDLQALEARWRGLWSLVDTAHEFKKTVKVRVLDVSWREINRDIDRAADFDQTALFQKIYSDEFDIPGGTPYGVIIGDYYVSHRPHEGHPYDDIEILRSLSQIAAASFAPFICGAAPQLFGLDDFSTLGTRINMEQVFSLSEYTAWRSFRSSEDARFLGVLLPQVLMREPYNREISEYGGIRFRELVEGPDASNYLWGNAAFAFGTVIIREFGETGWFAHIRGTPQDTWSGGLVTYFTSPYPKTENQAWYQPPTSLLITDNLERDLADQGLISLCTCYSTPFSAFFSVPSLHLAATMQSKSAAANARIGSMLQQILCASRFAHYIKVMIRDKVGSYTTATECERVLQKWIDQYATGRDDINWEMRAKYPLRDVQVSVKELPGSAGKFNCVIHLRPHYVADHLVSELRLTTELQSGSGN